MTHSSIRRHDYPVDARVRATIRRHLLGWFDRHGRDLPWRCGGVDAYRRWVSEIMLQQTQVETVIPFFRRFMIRFPDVRTLAAARQASVLRWWQGMGYYRRAIHLHRAA
jgi:A/G-specific adenine glycosylase